MTANVASGSSAWTRVPLGEIADVKLGKMLDKAKQPRGPALSYLRNINVRWGTIDTDDLLEMPFGPDELDRFGLQAGDVLVCEGGEPGRASVWDGRMPDLKFQKAIHRVRFKVPFEPRLLVYVLELLAKAGGLERRFTGSTIKHFTREAFIQLPVPVAPLAEQREIVAEIEKQFTRLEAGVASLRRVQANLKRYRAAVLKAACEGRLVPTEADFARQESRSYESGDQLLARILREKHEKWTERGQLKEPTVPDAAGLPPPPEGWTWATLAGITKRIADVDHKMPRSVSVGIPYVSTKDFIDNDGIDFSNAKRISRADYEVLSRKVRPESDDILLSRYGTVGEVRQVRSSSPFQASYSVAILKTLPLPALSAYLSCALRSESVQWQIRRDVRASAQPDLGLKFIRNFVVALPPLAEQTRIVEEVERRLSVADALEAVVSANLRRAIRLRQSILQDAFSGSLAPSHA